MDATLPNRGLTRRVWCVLGLPIDVIGMREAAEIIRAAIRSKQKLFLSTPNLNFVVLARTNREFRESLIYSDLALADGMPLVWVAKLLGIPLKERVAGSDLILTLQEQSTANPISIFFFGGECSAGPRACAALKRRLKGILPAGSYFPGFGPIDDMSQSSMIDEINGSDPDILAVALGARKGQAWIMRHRHRLNCRVISHLGAVVNFFANTVRRCPPWMAKYGFEWLWRITQEPALWRRYFNDGRVLAKLLATRIFPYAIWLLWHRKTTRERAPAQATVAPRGNWVKITLSGWCGADHLDEIRGSFALAATHGRSCELDFSEVTYIDAAFIGIIFSLLNELSTKPVRLVGVPTKIARIFYWNCAEFLLAEPSA